MMSSEIAIKSRNFQKYIAGSFVSWCFDWLDIVAVNWIILQLSGSPLLVGTVNVLKFLPIFFLSVPAGIIADRYDKKKTLVLAHTILAILTATLGWILAKSHPLWLFVLVYALRAAVHAIAVPVRSSLAPLLVEREAMGSSVATHSTAMTLASVVGPILATYFLASQDYAQLFYINAASFLFVMASLASVKEIHANARIETTQDSLKTSFQSLVSLARKSFELKFLISLTSSIMFFGFSYVAVLPIFVNEVSPGSANLFGRLMATIAVGSLNASLLLSFKLLRQNGFNTMLWALFGFASSFAFLSSISIISFYYVGAFGIGFFGQVFRSSSRMYLQESAPDHLRGRLTSVQLMDRGFIPLGIAFLCVFLEWSSARWTLAVMSLGCFSTLLVAIWIFMPRQRTKARYSTKILLEE